MYHMSAAKVSEKEEKSVIKCKIHNNKGIKYAEGSSSAETRETECRMKEKERKEKRIE